LATKGEKAGETRDAILDAAVELFITEGFEKTSMDAIAIAASVAKGTLYYHFKSKEGIVEAVVQRYASAMEAALSGIEKNEALDFVGKLAAFIEAMKKLNSESFSKLHKMKYIDIHEKTGAVMIERFAPYYARLMEEGNRQGRCQVEHPLECSEILLASSQALLAPEAGEGNFPRRIAAFISLSAKVLGMDQETVAKIYRPFEG
jgi:AcrR family transcriptional regulator